MAEKRTTYTTPAGIAGWTTVNKPSTKFKPQGEYSIKLVLTPEQAAPLQATFKKMAEEAKAAYLKTDAKKAALWSKYALHIPGSEDVDQEGNPTGNFIFNFKQDAVVTPKDKSKEPWEVKIGIFDAKGKPMPSEVVVGRGSKVKVAYEVCPFKNDANKQMGLTLRLKAVQVLELVQFNGNRDAGSYGFGAEEGYSAEEAGPTETTMPGESTDPKPANVDF